MTIAKQFSKHANNYDNNNIIQRIISKALVRELQFKANNILELGCGSGQIFREISWDFDTYTAIDFSPLMCDLHPKQSNLEVKCFDFDSLEFKEFLKNKKYDLVISSSSLQWSKDLKKLLQILENITSNLQTVLFTSNTFKKIYEITKQKKSILSLDEIKNAFSAYDCSYEVLNYKLQFENKKDLFRYIKNSGVQGEIKLNYKDAKSLYKNYDLNYLEFEVVFIKTKLKPI